VHIGDSDERLGERSRKIKRKEKYNKENQNAEFSKKGFCLHICFAIH
jgi:hypothetical protein